VLAVDGQSIADRSRLIEIIRATGADGAPREMTWRIERAGPPLEIPITPAVVSEGDKRVGRVEAALGRRRRWCSCAMARSKDSRRRCRAPGRCRR
jgi:hypothetical protein